jgi:hypothetical protein
MPAILVHVMPLREAAITARLRNNANYADNSGARPSIGPRALAHEEIGPTARAS